MNAMNETTGAAMNITTNDSPVVGEGATFTVWTDRHACTVLEIRKNGKEVVLQRDKATLLSTYEENVSGGQRWSYEADPNGEIIVVSARKLRDGTIVWKQVGQKTKDPGGYAKFNRRSEHYDFHF